MAVAIIQTTNLFNITNKIFSTLFGGMNYAKFSLHNSAAYDLKEKIHPFLFGNYQMNLPLDRYQKEDYFNPEKWDEIEIYLNNCKSYNQTEDYKKNFFNLKLNFYLFHISIQNEDSHLGQLFNLYHKVKRNPTLTNINELEFYYYKIRLIYINLDCILPQLHNDIIDLLTKQKLRYSFRYEPVWFNFCGEAGIGKSLITRKISLALSKHYSEKPYFHISHKDQSKDFYDNYNGEKTIVYDDLGQKSVSEFSNFVQMISPNPYTLNCAQAENKGNKFLENNYFISSCNMTTMKELIRHSPVSDPQALLRRMFEIDMSHVVRNDDNTYNGRVYVNKYVKGVRISIFEYNMNKGVEFFVRMITALIHNTWLQKKEVIGNALNFEFTLDEVLKDNEIITFLGHPKNSEIKFDPISNQFICKYE